MTEHLTSLEKGIEILRIVASRTDGCQMTGLVAESGIPRTSVLRLVSQLEGAGLVDRSTDRRTLYLGPMLLRFGDLARQRHTLVDRAQTVLSWLSEQTGKTCYLSVRHGLDAVCLARSEGLSYVRAVMLEVGTRRPLGLGAGSIAVLAQLETEDLEEVLEINCARAAQQSYDVAAIREMVRRAGEEGIAGHHGQLVAGVWGLGIPVCNAPDRTEAAISLSFVASHVPEEERQRDRACLREAALRMERRLHGDMRRSSKGHIRLTT